MKNKILFGLLVVITLFIGSMEANAQQERKFIRSGNKQFVKGDFVSAEVDYLRALDKDSTSYAAIFNLGDALYKQQKYEDALARFSVLAADSINVEKRPAAFYNVGNTHFEMKKYEEAIEAYKNSLRMNPSDTLAKFNLAYAQLMLQKQQDQDKQDQEKKDDKDNKDQDKDKKDQNQDQNKDNQDQNKDQDKKDQDKKDQDKKDGDGKDQPQQPEPKIGKDQAEKMLQAIQANEDKTQQKVKDKKEKGVVVGGSRKNW